MRSKAIVLMAAMVVTGAVRAHHAAVATYDPTRSMEITGVVVDFRMRNPHSLIVLDVTNDSGEVERWEIEANSAIGLTRVGWDENTFRPGDVISVSGWPHRQADLLMNGKTYFTADGSEVRPGSTTRSGAYPADPGATGLSGRWLPPWRGPADDLPPGSPLPLTRVGLDAWNNYEEERSPLATCEPMNIPVLFYPAMHFDLRVGEREAVLHYELFDVTRTVPLDSDPRQVDESGLFGRSSGRLEGEELVIETSGFPPSDWGLAISSLPLGNGADVPSSDQKRLTERYSVSDDGQTLNLRYTVADPVYLAEPFSDHVQMTRLADDAPLYEYRCDPDSASLFTGLPEDR